MSTTIDNRVVKMTFDNAQFEKGVRSTMQTIDAFEKKLDLKGATAGFSKISEAANKLNLTPLGEKADKIKTKFDDLGKNASDNFSGITDAANKTDLSGISDSASKAITQAQDSISGLDTASIVNETNQAAEGFNAFSVVAVGALLEVGNQITEFVTGGLNKLVSGIAGLADKAIWQPMKDGFEEYQTQIGSIQTIMANTGRDFHDAAQIADVNSALDTLNTYADKTIYNFTEMTRNIGTFTAAGVSMEDAVPAIQGIANMAALSGSSSQQASTAMYQLSQALAAGTVKLMDWNSVVNAGMGGKVFQDKLLETAYHIHGANGELETYGGTLDAVKNGSLSFRDSLQEEWITSEVLTEALQQMTYSYDDMSEAEISAAKARLESLGYTDKEIEKIFQLGKAATESATKVRTWSQLWSTVGEALGSGWAQTWRIIIGDFKDATNLFTYLSQKITGVVDTISNARNAVVEGWAAFGGRDFLFGTFKDDPNGGLPIVAMNGALQNFVDMLNGWVEPMSKAFEDVFDFFNDDFNIDPKSYNADFARVLKQGGDEVIKYREDYLAQFEQGTVEYQEAINELNRTEEMFNQGVFDGFDPKTLLWDEVGQSLAGVTEGFQKLTASLVPSQDMMNGLYGIFGAFFSVIETGITIIGALIEGISGIVTVARILIDPLTDIVFHIGGSVGRIISEVMGYVTDIVNALVEFGDKIFGWVAPALKGLVDGFLGIIDIHGKIDGVTGVIINLMRAIWNFLDIPGKIVGVADIIRDVFDWLFKALGIINDDVGENAKTWDNLGQRIANCFNDIKNKVIDAVPFLRNIIDWFKKLFAVFSSEDSNAMQEFIKTHFEEFKKKATEVLKPLIDLGNAIKDFITKSFEKLHIVDKAKGSFDKFANIITNKLGKIPKVLELVGTALAGAFGGIASSLNIPEKINGLTEYFSNLTPEKVIDDIVKFGNDIKDKFNGIIDYFNSNNMPKIGMDFFDQFDHKIGDVDNILTVATGKLKERFPEFSGEIDAGYRTIKKGLGNISGAIHDILGPAFAESENLPELIINIFKRVSQAIRDGISNLITIISNVKLSDAFNFIISPFRKFLDWIEQKFPGLSKYIEPIKNTFNNLSKSLEDSGLTIGDVFYKIFEAIGNFLQEHAPWLVDGVKGIVDTINNLPDSFKNFGKVIINALSHIPGPLGDIFGGLSNLITGFTITSENESVKMPGVFQEMFGGVKDPADEAGDSFLDFLRKFDPASLPQTMKDLGKTIIDKLKEQLNQVKEYIKGLPDKLKTLVDGLVSNEGTFKNILDRIQQIVQSGITLAIASFVKDLGSTMKNLAKAIKAHESNDFSEKLRNIALSLGGIAIVVAVLGKMSVGEVIQGTLTVAAIAVFLGVLAAVGNKIANKNIQAFKEGTKGIKTVANALTEVGVIVIILGKMSKEELEKALINIALISGLLVAVLALSTFFADLKGAEMEKGTKSLQRVATSLLEISVALLILAPALKALGEVFNNEKGAFDVQRLVSVGIALGAVIALMAGFIKLTEKTKAADLVGTASALLIFGAGVAAMSVGLGQLAGLNVPVILAAAGAIAALMGVLYLLTEKSNAADLITTSIGLIAFGGAIVTMSAGLKILQGLDVGTLIAGGIALSGLIVVLGLFTKWTQEADLIVTSLGLVVFAGAMVGLSYALSMLAGINVGSLLAGAVALGALVAALGLFSEWTKEADLMVTSLGLVVFSGAMIGLSYALSMLAGIDLAALATATACLAALIAVLGIVVAVLSNPEIGAIAMVILPLLSFAFLSVGAAAWLIAQGLNVAIDAVLRLATAGPLLAQFVQTIADNLVNFGMAAVAFVALGAGMIALGAGMGVLGIALLAFGATSGIAAAGITALTWALNGLLDLAARFEEFSSLGANITAGIGQGMQSGLEGLAGIVSGIINFIIGLFTGGFQINSPSELMANEIGQYIPEGIGMGIDNNSGGLMDTLGGTLGELINRFTTWVNEEGLPKLQEFGNNLLDKVKNEIIPNILNWVETEGIPKLGEMARGVVDHIFEEIGKLPGKLFEIATTVPRKLIEGIQMHWHLITEIGSNIINGIVEGIKSIPGAISDAIIGMASGGLEDIKRFFGIASPSKVMRDEVGRWIPAGLAEGISEYAKVAINAGVDFAKDVTNGINDNINIVNPEMNFDYGTITPVLDMSGIDTAIDNYNKQWSGLDFNTTNTNMQNIDANLDLTPMLRNTLDQTNQIGVLRGQNGELLSAITGLRNEIAEYNDIMSRMAIVMDTGTLVGALSSDIDNALGQRQVLAERGVY